MIAITGYRGFIGRHLVADLMDRGVELLLVDKVLDWAPGGVTMSPDGFLRDAVPAEVEAVVHLGATTDTTLSDLGAMVENNTEYSKLVWWWCAEHSKPLVYASSAAVYGDGSKGFSEDSDPGALQPLNAYGLSKLYFDHHALSVAAERQPPRWYGLRFFNVYGRGEGAKGRMASMVHQACRQARDEGEVVLFEHGKQSRDYVHVSDVVQYVRKCLFGSAQSGIYNVGSGTCWTFNELAEIVFDELGTEPRTRYVPMPAALAGRYQEYTKADVGKAWRLCVNSAMPLRMGVRDLLGGLAHDAVPADPR